MENLDEIGKMLGKDQNTINMVKKMMRENPQMIESLMTNMVNNGSLDQKQQPKKSTKIKPNEKCPCNSGKKYKKCCNSNDLSN